VLTPGQLVESTPAAATGGAFGDTLASTLLACPNAAPGVLRGPNHGDGIDIMVIVESVNLESRPTPTGGGLQAQRRPQMDPVARWMLTIPDQEGLGSILLADTLEVASAVVGVSGTAPTVRLRIREPRHEAGHWIASAALQGSAS